MSASPREVAVGEDAPILDVMSTMRAMRRLKPDPVPRELLERLVQAATWAPSGGNEQNYEFVVVDDRAVMRELAGLWERSASAYEAAMHDEAIERMGEEKARPLIRALQYQREHFAETPAVIVPCYSRKTAPSAALTLMRGIGGPLDVARFAARGSKMAVLTEAASIYPAVQNLLLAARALGLGANITTWHMFLEHEWKRVLGIPRGVHTYAVIPVGWPLGRFGPVTRRPAREAIHWDRW
ncbi:MAG TPA: nitroreductase family protein [Solirubrobacteraceae bacterium]|jgi:nitroreductase